MRLLLPMISALALLLVGCASSKVVVVPGDHQSGTSIKKIAVVSDSLLAENVGLNLSSLGFFVAPATSGIDAMSISSPTQRQALSDAGFDALLVVRSTDDGEGRPQNANALIYSVETGQLVTGVKWENGHGFGIRGSVTNEAMKADQHEAAEQIAEELAKVIPR